MLSTLLIFLTLTLNPGAKFNQTAPLLQEQQTDTLTMLTQTWVVREQFHAHGGQLEPVQPRDKMEMSFRKDGTYTITRFHNVSDAESIEIGKWRYDSSRGFLSMQTRQVNGRDILTTMLPRWQVLELSEHKLVLLLVAMSGSYLVLEAQK